MSSRWLPGVHGLRVDLGRRHYEQAFWLRAPAAEFTCRYGCALYAQGGPEVARFTQDIDEHHARVCPGPREERPDGDHP